MKKKEKIKDYYYTLDMKEACNIQTKTALELQGRKKEINLEYKKALTEQIRDNAMKQRESSLKDYPMDLDQTGYYSRKKQEINKNDLINEMKEFMEIKNQLKDNDRKEADETDK